MKTTLTLSQKHVNKTIRFISIIMVTLFACNLTHAQSKSASASEISNQERTIKGVVNNDEGPLSGVNILLKGTLTGTTTDKNGAFTFPKALNTGDILVFSYLGYETQDVKIKKNTTFIKLILSNDLIEIIGALDSNKPYKSKRKN